METLREFRVSGLGWTQRNTHSHSAPGCWPCQPSLGRNPLGEHSQGIPGEGKRHKCLQVHSVGVSSREGFGADSLYPHSQEYDTALTSRETRRNSHLSNAQMWAVCGVCTLDLHRRTGL